MNLTDLLTFDNLLKFGTLAATLFGIYLSYKKLNVDRKSAMASTVKQLTEANQITSEQLAENTKEIASLNDRLDELQRDYDRITAENHRLRNENAELSTLRVEVMKLKKEIDLLREDNERVRDEKNNLERRVNTLLDQLRRLGQEPTN